MVREQVQEAGIAKNWQDLCPLAIRAVSVH